MGLIIFTSFLALVTGLILLGNTRSARMRRYAKRNHAQFDRHRSSLTTPLSAGKLEIRREAGNIKRIFSLISPRNDVYGQLGLYALG